MKILIFGQVDIDKNISENSSYTGAGSPPMFMQKIYKQLPDCQTTIIASYGSDYLPYLKDVSIYPKKPNSKNSLVYENISKQGTRAQKAYFRDEAIPIPIDDQVKDLIRKADAIIIAPILPNFSDTYLKQIRSLKRKNTLMVLSPQGFCRDFLPDNSVVNIEFALANKILPLVDMVIVSEQDAPDMLVKAKQWAEKFNIIVVATLGEKGAVAFEKDREVKLISQTVPESDIVDSVGSGDIFSAGFTYRYSQTKDLKEAGRFANQLARQCLFFTSENIKIDYKGLVS